MANWYVCGVCKGQERMDEDGNYNHSCPGPPKTTPPPAQRPTSKPKEKK